MKNKITVVLFFVVKNEITVVLFFVVKNEITVVLFFVVKNEITVVLFFVVRFSFRIFCAPAERSVASTALVFGFFFVEKNVNL